jgi:hypothetical protein
MVLKLDFLNLVDNRARYELPLYYAIIKLYPYLLDKSGLINRHLQKLILCCPQSLSRRVRAACRFSARGFSTRRSANANGRNRRLYIFPGDV